MLPFSRFLLLILPCDRPSQIYLTCLLFFIISRCPSTFVLLITFWTLFLCRRFRHCLSKWNLLPIFLSLLNIKVGTYILHVIYGFYLLNPAALSTLLYKSYWELSYAVGTSFQNDIHSLVYCAFFSLFFHITLRLSYAAFTFLIHDLGSPFFHSLLLQHGFFPRPSSPHPNHLNCLPLWIAGLVPFSVLLDTQHYLLYLFYCLS